jgi:hypothetical protein
MGNCPELTHLDLEAFIVKKDLEAFAHSPSAALHLV